MSLFEPLLPKEEVEDQKLQNYSIDPLTNLKNSIENLSVPFESFEIDGTSDINFRDSESIKEKEFYGELWKNWDIKCAASFDNKLIIGRIDGIIKIYDLDTKEEIVLKGHSNAVNCLQVTLKKDFLVSGSRDKTIIIWNLETYQQEKVFKADYEVFCLVVTSGYDLFYGSLSDRLIKKWNFRDENELSILSSHEDGITCMKISNNNEFLITGSLDRSLRIWSIQNSQELEVFNVHKGAVDQILITSDDKYIISASNQNEVIIWDLDKRELFEQLDHAFPKQIILGLNIENNCMLNKTKKGLAVYKINDRYMAGGDGNDIITALTCSKTNNIAYYGLDNNTVQMIDTDWYRFGVLKDFNCKIYKMLLVGNNDEYLASIMENGKIKIHEIYKVNKQEDFVLDYEIKSNSIKLTRDGKYLIAFNSNSLKIWNLIEKKDVFSYENIALFDVQISYDDKYFIFNNHNIIYVFSLMEMKEVAKFDLECGDNNFCFSISKDGRFIFAGKFDGTIAIFDIETKSKASTLEGATDKIVLLQTSKTNEYLVSVDNGKKIIFWSLLEKKIIKSFQFKGEIQFLKLNDKYNCVAIGLKNYIEIWDFQKQAKLISIPKIYDGFYLSSSCAEISEDENYLIFPLLFRARIWSFEYMKEVDDAVCPYFPLSLDITRDNKYIVTIGSDNKIAELWNFEEKRVIAKINFGNFSKLFIKFSADGKSIIAYNDKQARIHNIKNYVDCNRIESDPYFIPGEHDRNTKQRFVNWIKQPTEWIWEKVYIDIVVYPIGYNGLHSLCLNDNASVLSEVLKDGGEIFRDKQNMSPLSYALIRSSRRCIDEILNYVINLDDNEKRLYCIYQLREDIPLLFNSKSLNLIPFLEVLFRRRAQKDHVGFYEVMEELPMSIFSPVSKVYTSAFTGAKDIEKKEPSKQKESLIQFWGSPWGYNYTAGSEESLLLLKKIDESDNQNIFQTLLVQSVIREKWEYLWPAIITISAIYWLNLITMMWYIFDPNIYILSSFAVLNGILALYELMQFSTKPKDYVSEIWNLIDCIRIVLCVTWATLQFYDENILELSFTAVLFNFLRGLTYFRAFDITRFYVRLILMALSDSFAFLIIFLYSTLTFGILYASLETDLSFGDMWKKAYELNMGNFDNGGYSFLQYSCFTLATLINVVMMLNLLVSTLGDTFDKFQMITDELDTKEMIQLVIEFESIMFWARSEQAKLRNKGKLLYLQRCDIFQDSDVPDKWQGKIKEISLKIDGMKDDFSSSSKTASEELKKLEDHIKWDIGDVIESQENTKRDLNEKIQALDRKVEAMEPKINGMMEMLEIIKAKLDS